MYDSAEAMGAINDKESVSGEPILQKSFACCTVCSTGIASAISSPKAAESINNKKENESSQSEGSKVESQDID